MQLYPWQESATRHLKGADGILSAPTGSGKSVVAYHWADLLDPGKLSSLEERVIFTAPIKALSNERYLNLKTYGLNVGLETGDFKKNVSAPILCCTQEIYTNKYSAMPNQKVIIDEFHYVTNDAQRARAYIDGIVNTNPTSKLLIMSATFGATHEIVKYLNRLSGRSFQLFQTEERVTELVALDKPVKLEEIHDALVFVFSRKGVTMLAWQIAQNRPPLPAHKIKQLEELAEIFSVESLPPIYAQGVGIYYGTMLPKMKLLTETAFRNQIIDVVVGTDALALGVNLPAETVIFAQLAKYYEGPLKATEFWQMAGRAGRKGYFDTGYVRYYPSEFESFEYETEELFARLKTAPLEPMRIRLDISVPALLRKLKTPEEEAAYVAKNSLPPLSESEVMTTVETTLERIGVFAAQFADGNDRVAEEFKETLAQIYFPEFSLVTNLNLAALFMEKGEIAVQEIIDVVFGNEEVKNEFYGLLQVKKYLNTLSREAPQIKDTSKLDNYINELDPTVTDFEQRLKKAQQLIIGAYGQATTQPKLFASFRS